MKYILIFVWIFLSLKNIAGINYYVSVNGKNTNDGLTVERAFNSIEYAVNIASHGDTINVLAGEYINKTYGERNIWKREQAVRINNKNSDNGLYLVIRAYPGHKVKLKGDGDYVFNIRNSSYIWVEGFEIEGEVENIPIDTALKYQFVYRDELTGKDTVRVAEGTTLEEVAMLQLPVLNNITRPSYTNAMGLLVQGSHHIVVKRNHIHHHAGTGLRFFECDYFWVIENEIHDNSRRSSVGNHGFVIHSSRSIDENEGYKIFVLQNKVYDNYNEIYSWSELKTFINPHIDEGKGISLQKNTFQNDWKHGRMKIENNLAYHNGFSGIHVNEGERIDIINNTAFNNIRSFKGSGNNIGISVQEGKDIGFYNNITVAPEGGYALSAGNTQGLICNNNLIKGELDPDVQTVAENTLFGDPLFEDTLQYKLLKESPAINSADTLIAPVADYYNIIRDSMPDIGAVEFIATTNGKSSLKIIETTIFPNPTFDGIWIKNAESLSISVFSIEGKDITSNVLFLRSGDDLWVDLEALSGGLYMLNIGNKGYKIVKR